MKSKNKVSSETVNQLLSFREERNWKQFHNGKDLALSLSLEAAELLEHFQWSGSDGECTDQLDGIAEELADVLNYCVLLAEHYGLDMDQIMQAKIRKNAEKYPASLAYGRKDKYTRLKQSARDNKNET